MVGLPDADLLREAIDLLQKRIHANTATFLVKAKVYRAEPTNEESRHPGRLSSFERKDGVGGKKKSRSFYVENPSSERKASEL